MKILIISDCHSLSPDETIKLKNLEYNACFLLGDICDSYLKTLLKYIPVNKIYGILGNHDERGLLEENGIMNIHLHPVNINGITFMGFEGSHRYKRGPFIMYTQDEAQKLLETAPPVNILLSHEGPYELYFTNIAHCGFQAITEYLERNKTPLNIHGHQHLSAINLLNDTTTVVCVYKCALIDLNNLVVNTIF